MGRLRFDSSEELLKWLDTDDLGKVVEDADGDLWVSVGNGLWVCPGEDMGFGDKLVLHKPEGLSIFTQSFTVIVHKHGHVMPFKERNSR